MSGLKQNGKAADTPSPPQAEIPAQQGAASSTSKSYQELLYGFEEIRKIVVNQEKIDKGKSTVNNYEEILKGFEKIKKIVDDHEKQSG